MSKTGLSIPDHAVNSIPFPNVHDPEIMGAEYGALFFSVQASLVCPFEAVMNPNSSWYTTRN